LFVGTSVLISPSLASSSLLVEISVCLKSPSLSFSLFVGTSVFIISSSLPFSLFVEISVCLASPSLSFSLFVGTSDFIISSSLASSSSYSSSFKSSCQLYIVLLII